MKNSIYGWEKLNHLDRTFISHHRQTELDQPHDLAKTEMVKNFSPLNRYSAALPVPSLNILASTTSTIHGYSASARDILSLRTPALASSIHLAAARDEICRSLKTPPPAPLPSSPVPRPVATRPSCVFRDTSPSCEYKILVVELEQIRCCLDHCMLMRQVHRKAAKSGQNRRRLLLFKPVENDDKRLWGEIWDAISIAKKSQGQLEMHELEFLRLKARERVAIAAVSNFCVLYLC